MEKVGTVYVDAGCVMVGDPCYTQGTDATDHVESWDEFLRETWPNVFGGFGQINHAAQMEDAVNALGKPGLGIVVSSGYGDGEYPVYVTRKNGRIASLTVVFIDDEGRHPYEDEFLIDDEDGSDGNFYGSDPDEDVYGN